MSYDFDKENSKMEINAEKNALKLRISGISLNFKFDYKVWSDPDWIADEGEGDLKVFNSDLDL